MGEVLPLDLMILSQNLEKCSVTLYYYVFPVKGRKWKSVQAALYSQWENAEEVFLMFTYMIPSM